VGRTSEAKNKLIQADDGYFDHPSSKPLKKEKSISMESPTYIL